MNTSHEELKDEDGHRALPFKNIFQKSQFFLAERKD